ncbi:MAG: hypothetical protein ACFNUC_04315 [Selenomonas noxia]
MTAKEYLWRVRDAARELKLLEQEYEQARADILHLRGIAYDGDRVSGGKIGDLSDAIEALERYAKRVNAKWDELITLRQEAEAHIDALRDGRYREVLKRRYLRGQSLERIAVDLCFDYRWVKRLHGRALVEFQKLTPKSPL